MEGLVSVLVILASVAIPVVVAVVGVRRLRGKRSRFDRLFDSVGRAADASVYPETLRGHQPAATAEVDQVSTSSEVIRRTPAARHRRRRRAG
jgi:hypothetical protein